MPRGICNYEKCDNTVSFGPHPMYEGRILQFWCCTKHRLKDNNGLDADGNIRVKQKGKKKG